MCNAMADDVKARMDTLPKLEFVKQTGGKKGI